MKIYHEGQVIKTVPQNELNEFLKDRKDLPKLSVQFEHNGVWCYIQASRYAERYIE